MINITPRLIGKFARIAFAECAKSDFGEYIIENSIIKFKEKVFHSFYSDFHENTSGWFYGIKESDWKDWQYDGLLLIMKEGKSFYKVMFNKDEAIKLISLCGSDKNRNKKINVRRPLTGGKIYLIEWQEFPFQKRMEQFDLSVLVNNRG